MFAAECRSYGGFPRLGRPPRTGPGYREILRKVFSVETRWPVTDRPNTVGRPSRRAEATLISAAGAVGLLLAALGGAPAAHAYSSWCDLFEAHGARIAVVSEPLRSNPGPGDVDRLNSLYDNVTPQLNTVAEARFWYPNVYGSPDIRADMGNLVGAMRNLQDAANQREPAGAQVQAVDDAVGVLHQRCAGRRGLPATWPDAGSTAPVG